MQCWQVQGRQAGWQAGRQAGKQAGRQAGRRSDREAEAEQSSCICPLQAIKQGSHSRLLPTCTLTADSLLPPLAAMERLAWLADGTGLQRASMLLQVPTRDEHRPAPAPRPHSPDPGPARSCMAGLGEMRLVLVRSINHFFLETIKGLARARFRGNPKRPF